MEQINHFTEEPYTQGNVGRLEFAQKEHGFKSNRWMTFLQAKEHKLKIKKGATATLILIPLAKKKEDEDDKDMKGVKKCYVFNLDQTEEWKKEVKEEKREVSKLSDIKFSFGGTNV